MMDCRFCQQEMLRNRASRQSPKRPTAKRTKTNYRGIPSPYLIIIYENTHSNVIYIGRTQSNFCSRSNPTQSNICSILNQKIAPRQNPKKPSEVQTKGTKHLYYIISSSVCQTFVRYYSNHLHDIRFSVNIKFTFCFGIFGFAAPYPYALRVHASESMTFNS